MMIAYTQNVSTSTWRRNSPLLAPPAHASLQRGFQSLHPRDSNVTMALRDVEAYDGYLISKFVRQFLEPAFDTLEQRLAAQQLRQAEADCDALLRACNACHQATRHGYIKIEKRLDNPYLQSFSPVTRSLDK